MSDEEKKAIAEVKDVIEYDKEHRIVTIYDKQPLFRDTLQTLLNLIEKQQKELKRKERLIKAKIEEIKEEKEHYLEINDEYNEQICDCIIEECESLLKKEE